MHQPLYSFDFGSCTIWRLPKSTVDPARLARHLRLDDCDQEVLNDLQYYINVAMDDFERETGTVLGLQVREMTFRNLPWCGESLALECEPVWTRCKWEQWVGTPTLADTQDIPAATYREPWESGVQAQIEGCFSCCYPPVEIQIRSSSCSCSGCQCLTTECDFTVNDCRKPNSLEITNADCKCEWPCSCGCPGDQVTVRYLVGNLSDCPLHIEKPGVYHSVLMMAGVLYETPELGGLGNKSHNAMDFIKRHRDRYRWRGW